MSFNYSNPYQAQAGSSSSSVQTADAPKVLFTGLPLDVTENDLKDLLLADPLRLPSATTSVTSLYGSNGKSYGSAIVSVAADGDAERIRREYSGQQIDKSFVITVHHILKSTQALPSAPSLASRTTKAIPTGPSAKPASKPVPAKKVAPVNDKPLGLKLLARMAKPGNADAKQSSLLEKQRANRAKNAPGAALLNRLQSAPVAHAKPKNKSPRLSTGAQKVGRAKKATNAMEVDKPVVKKAKSQADLDEEMRAYERARRFA